MVGVVGCGKVGGGCGIVFELLVASRWKNF